MNAKKIMGAVLVALLAAALFVGAGAAADVKYLYVDGSGVPAGVYTAEGGYTIIVNEDGLITPGPKFESGLIYGGDSGYAVFTPDAEVVVSLKDEQSAVFTSTTSPGGAIPDSVEVDISVKLPVELSDVQLLFTSPVTGETFKFGTFDGASDVSGTVDLGSVAIGTWMVQAYFAEALNETAPQTYYKGTPYYFTIEDVGATITLSTDEVIKSNYFKVTLTGVPGTTVSVEADKEGFTVADGQPAVKTAGDLFSGNVKIVLDASGKATFTVKAESSLKKGSYTITYVVDEDDETKNKEATINVINGAITAETKKDSFFVGDKIELIGTSTAGGPLYFWIEGTNFPFMQISNEGTAVKNGEWDEDFAYLDITDGTKVLVAGTYTIFVTTNGDEDLTKANLMKGTYATVALTMVQPFISDVEANPVAIQGDDEYTITGIAEAAGEVRLYVFGTNFFAADYATIAQKDNGKFEFTLEIGDDSDEENYMAPGTYFYLIQHPMNDRLFNVWNGTAWDRVDVVISDGTSNYRVNPADFFYAATDSQNSLVDMELIFNAYKRGTNYAAQALLEEIAGQNIDDIFVQGTFEVAAQKLTVNPIPGEVAKGTALTVSGTSNSGEGVEVIVNVLAGTFGATVKGDDNAAIFLTAKAVTKDDGTWEAAIDTSKLPTGEYIVTVQIGTTMYDSAAVEIVDKAPVTPPADDKPDTPVTPPADDKPTEPETPGFGALAALAGLGAVAVLLLRRE